MSSTPPPEWHLTETYKGLITLSVEALKLPALVNGGAAVAVLTYLGNLASRSPPPVHLPNLKPAILWYSGGLLATVVAFIVAYVTQLRLFREEIARRGDQQFMPLHVAGVCAGCLLALFAAFAFGLGCLRAASGLIP